MTAAQFVSDVFLKATGKQPTFVSGSTKWLKILAIGNQYIRSWAREPGVDWHSLYTPDFPEATVTATDTFALDNTVKNLSRQEGDYVRIVHTDDTWTDYSIVDAPRLKDFDTGNYCAQVGRNLVFNRAFTADDPQFGGDIFVPCYLYPEEISLDADVVPVDDPMWLVLISAAEYVRNDITRQNQYGNLIAEANQSMTRMKEDNESQVDDIYMPWSPLGQTWS